MGTLARSSAGAHVPHRGAGAVRGGRPSSPDEEPITGSGWFTIERLRTEPDAVYPVGLADHLERFLADGHGVEPVDLGVVVED